MDLKTHWSGIYQIKAADNVSWYQQRPDLSLSLIHDTGIAPAAALIDVGAGASTLVDHLLAKGFSNITLLDLSDEALDTVRGRIGPTAPVTYIAGDVTAVTLPEHGFDLWHDRAVFHFLTEPAQRRKYVENARHALRPGGHLVVATFAPDGPDKCSGLPVMRYDARGLAAAFGDAFVLEQSMDETHRTPRGSEQQFVYCRFRKSTG